MLGCAGAQQKHKGILYACSVIASNASSVFGLHV